MRCTLELIAQFLLAQDLFLKDLIKKAAVSKNVKDRKVYILKNDPDNLLRNG